MLSTLNVTWTFNGKPYGFCSKAISILLWSCNKWCWWNMWWNLVAFNPATNLVWPWCWDLFWPWLQNGNPVVPVVGFVMALAFHVLCPGLAVEVSVLPGPHSGLVCRWLSKSWVTPILGEKNKLVLPPSGLVFHTGLGFWPGLWVHWPGWATGCGRNGWWLCKVAGCSWCGPCLHVCHRSCIWIKDWHWHWMWHGGWLSPSSNWMECAGCCCWLWLPSCNRMDCIGCCCLLWSHWLLSPLGCGLQLWWVGSLGRYAWSFGWCLGSHFPKVWDTLWCVLGAGTAHSANDGFGCGSGCWGKVWSACWPNSYMAWMLLASWSSSSMAFCSSGLQVTLSMVGVGEGAGVFVSGEPVMLVELLLESSASMASM